MASVLKSIVTYDGAMVLSHTPDEDDGWHPESDYDERTQMKLKEIMK